MGFWVINLFGAGAGQVVGVVWLWEGVGIGCSCGVVTIWSRRSLFIDFFAYWKPIGNLLGMPLNLILDLLT